MNLLQIKAANESAWSRQFTKAIEKVNGKVLSIVASEKQTPGWPDRFISHAFWQGFIEIKRLKNDLTTLQRETIYELNRHRAGSAFVLWLVDCPNGTMHPMFLQCVDFRPAVNREDDWPSFIVDDCHTALELLHRLKLLTETLRGQ